MPLCTMTACPEIDPSAPLQFVINAAAGSSDGDTRREVIETALQAGRRRGHLHFCQPEALQGVALEAAEKARSSSTAVVAVGGDGTLNTVAQAAHASGCPMGVVPYGTFNYFARSHGIACEPMEAMRMLMDATAQPVRVGVVNDRVFLVNASLGLYPDLLEDREAFKRRFGRSRWVAFWAASATLLRAQRQLRLHIEQGASVRDIRALTLFVGNNRLQLEQLGVEASHGHAGGITAVMLKPVGTLAMLGLMLRGAMGTLGEAQSVERFAFNQLVVKPTLAHGRRGVKVAFDGEVMRMRAPLHFCAHTKPLYVLMPPCNNG
jgi:diacylglycerol kinase family enzyme